MINPATYKAFFANMVANSATLLGPGNEIKSFYFGESERILGALKSDIVYPALWLDRPEFRITERGDNMTQDTMGAFSLIANTTTDGVEEQDFLLELLFETVQNIIKYLREQNTIVWANDGFFIEPISAQMADNCYGYRVSFTVKYQEVTFLA